jgi:23S rRNA (uracil1939-C5)-methyltransferase
MTSDRKTRPALERGQRVELRIESLTPTGSGVSKDLGMPVFIDLVAPGDLAEVEVFDVRKDFARGRLLRLIEPSPMRAEPPCPLFKICGGCQWQHLSYEAQLESKTEIMRQAVRHIGGLEPTMVRDTLGGEPLNYRNKVQFPVRNPQGSQRILAGYFKKDSHELVNVKYCPVEPTVLDRMLEVAKAVLEDHKIWAYDERTGKGSLRHINARTSFASGKVLVTLVR